MVLLAVRIVQLVFRLLTFNLCRDNLVSSTCGFKCSSSRYSAVETLAAKMEEAQVLLAACTDLAQCSELIKFIEQCAECASVVKYSEDI
jgi:hypothetical protein